MCMPSTIRNVFHGKILTPHDTQWPPDHWSASNIPKIISHKFTGGNACLASLSQSQFGYFCSDIYKTHCSNQVIRSLNQVSDSLGVDNWAHSWKACGALKPWRETMEMSDLNRRGCTLVKKTRALVKQALPKPSKIHEGKIKEYTVHLAF